MWLFTIWSVYICSLNVKRWSRLRENFYDAGGKMEMKKKIEERTKSGRCLKNYFRTHIYCFFIQYAETQLCFALITSATLKLLKVCFELPKSTKQHNIRLAFLYSHSAILILAHLSSTLLLCITYCLSKEWLPAETFGVQMCANVASCSKARIICTDSILNFFVLSNSPTENRCNKIKQNCKNENSTHGNQKKKK